MPDVQAPPGMEGDSGADLRVTFADARVFKGLLEGVKDVMQSMDIVAPPNGGWEFQSKDTSGSFALHGMLKLPMFDSFHARKDRREDEPLAGLNVDKLLKLLKIEAGDPKSCRVYLHVARDSDVLTVRQDYGGGKMMENRVFQAMTDSEFLQFPPLESSLGVRIMMPTAMFKNYVTQLTNFGDYVKITVTAEDITFESRGDCSGGGMTSKMRTRVTGRSAPLNSRVTVDNLGTWPKGAPVAREYQLASLRRVVKASHLSPILSLWIPPAHPMCVDYPIFTKGINQDYLAGEEGEENNAVEHPVKNEEDVGEEGGYLRFWLQHFEGAPIVDEADE